MLTFLHLLACIGNNRQKTVFEKWGFLLFVKIVTLWILLMGFYYGVLFGTAVGITVSALLYLESATLCYLVIAVSGLWGLYIAVLPAYVFHYLMNKLI